MADFLITDLTGIAGALADNTSFEAHRNGQSGSEKFTGTDLKTYLGHDFHTYVATRWYVPMKGTLGSNQNGSSASTIYLVPAHILQPCTISSLAARVDVLQASENFQLAIYAASATTRLPTGNALGSTPNMSTTSATMVSQDLSSPAALSSPGLYWFGLNKSHATPKFTCILNSSLGDFARLVGDATIGNVFGQGSVTTGLSFAHTFGTWPDLSGQTFGFVSGGTQVTPAIAMKVSSVP